MAMIVRNLVVAVLGGDKRYVYLVKELIDRGATLKVLGFPQSIDLGEAVRAQSLYDVMLGANVIILPMAGIDSNGCINSAMTGESWYLSDEALDVTAADVLLITGVMPANLEQLVARRNIMIKVLTDDDTFAIYNSIPTAEGAVLMAMQNSEITLHGSSCFTLGYGRCGKTLALMLKGIGADSFAVARKSSDLARILGDGLRPVAFNDLEDHIHQADFVFNTIPHKVLTRRILQKMRKGSVIIDIASSPGGTDFVAARNLGITAELAPSLPGKVAPRTSGLLMAKVVWEAIANEFL